VAEKVLKEGEEKRWTTAMAAGLFEKENEGRLNGERKQTVV
jgi:hypothetical protein